ncbi:hypothetical protein BGZ68_007986 [Mortierella alpina]|nr:hypothetical protein BGZ68_007986 [Mortierella alpina]
MSVPSDQPLAAHPNSTAGTSTYSVDRSSTSEPPNGLVEYVSTSSSSIIPAGHGNLDPGLPQLVDEGAVTLPFRQLMAVFTGLILGVFLASLDQTIVSVCTTTIANEFHSQNDIPWLGAAYLLTTTSFQPL